MPLTPATKLGVYEIVAPLGAGGMGEVYRAKDTKLGRFVALKILPDLVQLDPDRVSRFEREAKALAALNHPHVASLHGMEEADGRHFLIMELVEGETVADRLRRGPIPLQEAPAIAIQIAEALEAAHEKGIIHRDLKPANIKITPDGKVKVLDFGLAKAMALAPGDGTFSNSPTLTMNATEKGVILGTPAYMSPEQAKGLQTDRRSDIFSFGVVLYEMLTGRQPFQGETAAEILASVLTREPDETSLPPSTPPSVRRLLRRCLQKERRNRLHDIADARLELQDALTRAEDEAPIVPRRIGRTRERLAWLAAITVLAVFGAGLWWRTRGLPHDTGVDGPAYRTAIVLPPDLHLSIAPPARFALSPDGRRLALAAKGADQQSQLFVRSLDRDGVEPIAHTEGAAAPFWSPDSRFIGFFSGGKLKKIDVSGGPPVTLAAAHGALGGTWNGDDVIVFASHRSALHRVSASGGPVSTLGALATARGETAHIWPAFLPDGRHFIFHATGSKGGGSFDPNGIYVASLDSPAPKLLLPEGSNAQYSRGSLFFLRQDTLLAQPFAADRLELTGNPVVVAPHVAVGANEWTGAFSVSPTGVLAFQGRRTEGPSQLVWFDRTGARVGTLGDPAHYWHHDLSPDETRAAVAILDPSRGTRDLWIVDVARGVRTRFTTDETDERSPAWSPDGTRVAFTVGREGRFDVYEKAVNGGAAARPLVQDALNKYPTSWSPDGKHLLYYTGGSTPGTGNDIWVLSSPHPARPFLQTRFNEVEARFSPDGRWVAYESNESGRVEVYVVSFPNAAGKRQVSSSGGRLARWNADGGQLYYVAPDGVLMSATMAAKGSDLQVGEVRRLFAIRSAGAGWVAPSRGGRFLVNTAEEQASQGSLTLIVNWTRDLASRPD